MAKRLEFKKGFLRLQRLGPIKFAEQSRWANRAPESFGLWAFPYPHFDIFYAYHKFGDLAPKSFRERRPTEAKWYTKDWDEDEPLDAIEFVEIEEYGVKASVAHYRDENGELKEASVRGAWHQEKEDWINTVGKKILPMREFWYSGDLYTHFNHGGSVGNWTMNSGQVGNDWTLMDVSKLAALMTKPGGVAEFDGHYDGDGKPRLFDYSKDHLEVFIPRGRGVIRDRL
jgi:hypothetical protein